MNYTRTWHLADGEMNITKHEGVITIKIDDNGYIEQKVTLTADQAGEIALALNRLAND